jgi:acetyltransferase-like isoleucine patch superfamily enzyme
MEKHFKFLARVNFKSLIFNLKYLPFKQAIKFPFLISRKVSLLKTKGEIVIENNIQTGMIQIGYGQIGIFDKKKSRSIWQVSGKVIFKGKTNIGHGSKISVAEFGLLELGNNFNVTAESSIVAHKHIQFGEDCLISWECLIMDTDFHKIYDKEKKIINSPTPIIIGKKVWISCRSLILKGTKIADNTIIGGGSLVSKDISNQSGLYAGSPVKFLKKDITWEI